MSAGMSTVKVTPDAQHPTRFAIEVDGVDMAGVVTRATLDFEAGAVPMAILEFTVAEGPPGTVEVPEARVYVGAETVALLKRVGWTPPEQDGTDRSGLVVYTAPPQEG